MTIVNRLLDKKGYDVWTIGANATVYDAVDLMSDKDVGALIVMDGPKIVGIITERLYAREVILKERASKETAVSEIMDTRVPFVSLKNTVEECMAIMNSEVVRHLPVLDDDRLVGIISMSDLIRARVEDQDFLIDELVQYVHGSLR